jgi:hypothetical protein
MLAPRGRERGVRAAFSPGIPDPDFATRIGATCSLSWQRLGLARYVGTVFVSCGVLEWAALAAVLPDRVLDEPGKGLWKAWIELPSIDPFSDSSNFAGSVIVCSAMM